MRPRLGAAEELGRIHGCAVYLGASMRPRLGAAEELVHSSVLRSAVGHASMRPRLGAAEERASRKALCRRAEASMRPRLGAAEE